MQFLAVCSSLRAEQLINEDQGMASTSKLGDSAVALMPRLALALASLAALRFAGLILVLQLPFTQQANAAPLSPNTKNNIESYRRTYKCRYYGYREAGSMTRFSSDGDEKGRILTIDSTWQFNKSKRSFSKSTKTKELVIDGKTFGPRFINSVFEIDDMMLTRGHGFVGDKMDYISYYECFDLY